MKNEMAQPNYDEPRLPRHDPPTPKRRGCSILGFVVIGILASLVPGPSSEPAALALSGTAASVVTPAPTVVPLPETDGASSMVQGVATYCAPTPKYCKNWTSEKLLGATPDYDGHPYWAKVTADDGFSVIVRVVSFCACGDRGGKPTVIDLSTRAFKAINHGSLAAGVIDVTLESGNVPKPRLPATDTE